MKIRYTSMVVRLAALATLALPTALPTPAAAQGRPTVAVDGQWHFVVAPYFWASGLKGDVSVKGLPEIPIEKSFSDIWSDFHIGALGHFEGRKDRWGFATDIMYMDLHAPVASTAPVVGALGLDATVKSLTVEGLGFYRVASGRAEGQPGLPRRPGGGPLLRDERPAQRHRTQRQRVGGRQERASMGRRPRRRAFPRAARLPRSPSMGRGDLAGFGSKLTWNLEGDLAAFVSDHWTVGAGWRHLDIDYDKGTGTDRKLFDVAYDGPRAWFAYAW